MASSVHCGGSMSRREVAPSDIEKPLVLVAEDDNDFRDYLAQLLLQRGYRVCRLADGRQLLAAIAPASGEDTAEGEGGEHGRESLRISAIVADYHMPRVDGMAALETFALQGVAGRFVLISAFVDEDTIAWARSLGAADVLAKPFGRDDLLEAVDRASTSPGQHLYLRTERS